MRSLSYIKNGKWVIDRKAGFNPRIRDRKTLMKNVYRVLLTRSRKGMFLYIPENADLNETNNFFKEMMRI